MRSSRRAHGSTPSCARYAKPEPRIAAGRWLGVHGATAMLDISDGLAQDAGQLAAASGVSVDIALEKLPCWPGVSPIEAAASGEEFELLVTLPPEFTAAATFVRATGLQLTRIGKDRRQPCPQIRGQLDVFTDQSPQHPARLPYQMVEIEHTRTKNLAAAEREELPR